MITQRETLRAPLERPQQRSWWILCRYPNPKPKKDYQVIGREAQDSAETSSVQEGSC